MPRIDFARNMPLDGLAGLQQNWKTDLLAGFMVFLIALPLCLGVSIASGFPPIAGVFTAVIGGVLVSILGSAKLTIKGPAAGLIAIAIACVEELGTLAKQHGNFDAMAGYKLTLAVIVVASVLQVVFGLLKAGKLGDLFPSSVVHGMLAAIGIIIIAKQLPVLLGVKASVKEPLELLAHIPVFLSRANPVITFIGGISLLIMFTLPLFKHKLIKRIPASLLVLGVAIPLGIYFMLYVKHAYHLNDRIYFIDPKTALVNLPTNMLNGITFPVFTYILDAISIKYIIMFALVGSIESMLTVKATDGLDPYHRKSDMNRDLMAVGFGNVLASLIGGLPMIAEVVRSSANISNGAKTRWANFFHGVFLLVFVAFVPQLLGFIPLTALAAMLIFTGIRLASPREFRGMYRVGKEQFLFFFLTMFITLATDLLLGVLAGIIIKIVFEILVSKNFLHLFKASVRVQEKGNVVYVDILKPAVFTNYLGYKKHLEALPKGKKLVINFTQANLIDHTFRENLHNFEYDYHLSGGSVELEGLDYHAPLSDHPLAVMHLTTQIQEKQSNLSVRQTELQHIATQAGAEFYPEQMYNHLRLKIFPYFKGAKIRKMQNRLIKRTENAVFEIFDVFFVEADITQHRYEMSIMLVHHLKTQVPDMQLQKEGLVTRYVKNNADIDFESHVRFSNHYFLQGKDKEEVRAFFTPQMLQIFEQNTDYEMEARHNVVLLHSVKRLLAPHEAAQLLKFSEKMIATAKPVNTPELAYA
jgi:MFS superfamily sulfate permease-like transporter